MNSDTLWHRKYAEWKARATRQAFEMFHAGCEVCENGSVYLGNLVWAPAGTVEPWQEPDAREG